MRAGIKHFKEFDNELDWRTYVSTFMMNTVRENTDSEIRIITGRGETIAVWFDDGHGYIEECRSTERLKRMYY